MPISAAGATATRVKREHQRTWLLQRRAVLPSGLTLGFTGSLRLGLLAAGPLKHPLCFPKAGWCVIAFLHTSPATVSKAASSANQAPALRALLKEPGRSSHHALRE